MTTTSQLPLKHGIGKDLRVGKGSLSLFNRTSQTKLESSAVFLTGGHTVSV